MKGQTLMIVRIRMSDGIVGVGQGTTVGGLAYGPESPEDMMRDQQAGSGQ